VEIELEKIEEDPWVFQVTLLEDDTNLGEYVVSMSGEEYRRYAGSEEPGEVVQASLRFLLDREAPEMILDRFSLSQIEGFFPEYPSKLPSYL